MENKEEDRDWITLTAVRLAEIVEETQQHNYQGRALVPRFIDEIQTMVKKQASQINTRIKE